MNIIVSDLAIDSITLLKARSENMWKGVDKGHNKQQISVYLIHLIFTATLGERERIIGGQGSEQ